MTTRLSRVLMVDDNEDDHFYNEVIIKSDQPDAELIKAWDGQQALDILFDTDDTRGLIRRGEAPDVILLDINMPGMGGFEFLDNYAARVAQVTDTPPPVVVMISSSHQTDDMARAEQYDCVAGHLPKPLSFDALDALLSRQ